MNADPRGYQVVSTIDISNTADLGPLHTILVDEQGNIYCSDEFNHAIISLNDRGELRWRQNRKGAGAAEFWYPRGMSLGRLQHNGALQKCLAIADSWNRRVQFLSVDGSFLAEWDRAADTAFAEVADVRFITTDRDASTGGYWLVLDRGNHRLCAVSNSGESLFQIGRCFSPRMTDRWIMQGIFLQDDPGNIDEFPAVDFLYYPSRIFGRSEDALYIWEPLSQRLKLVLRGNCLPISIDSPNGDQWIAADGAGFISWSAGSGRLRFCGPEGDLAWEGEVKGTPIPSNLPSNQCWLQLERQIQLLTMTNASHEVSGRPVGARTRLLLRTPLEEADLPAEGPARQAIEDFLTNVNGLTALVPELLAPHRRSHFSEEWLAGIRDRIRVLKEGALAARAQLCTHFHHVNLGMLALRLAEPQSFGQTASQLEDAVRLWNVLSEPLRLRLPELVQRSDDLFMACFDLFLLATKLPEAPLPERLPSEEVRTAGHQLQAEIDEIVRWIHSSCAPASNLRRADDTRYISKEKPGEPGDAIRRPAVRSYKQSASFLKEVDRISVGGVSEAGLGGLLSLARGEAGQLLVSLYNAHRVVCLDGAGKLRGSIGKPGTAAGEFQGPAGLAIGADNRLWVVESANRRIQIFEPPYEKSHLLGATEESPFGWPVGICALPDGSMLITDPGKNQILRLSSTGTVKTICRIGTSRGEVRQPLAVCVDPADPRPAAWVVDRRNHRLQKLDPAGHCLREIGALTRGPLFYPSTLAVFSDGTIVVAEDFPHTRLLLLSSRGEELGRMRLDYTPGGMLVEQNRLLVTEHNGDSILAYERR